MSRVSVSTPISFTRSFHVARFLIIATLLFLAATPRQAAPITINMEYTDEGDPQPHDENPSWDPAGVILKRHFDAAKLIWERLLPGPGNYEFDFHWDDDIVGLGLTTDAGVLDVFIEISSATTINGAPLNWFADPTPNDDLEFNLTNAQRLYDQLSGSDQSTYFPGTAPPGALEVGYRGAGLALHPINGMATNSDSGVAGVNASNGYDLLSTIVHEIGHVLGISSDPLGEPGEYNIFPQHVGGLEDVLVLEGDGGHLGGVIVQPGSISVPGFLMCNACGVPGTRRFPTATDVLVIAEDQGLDYVHLQRVGRISSGMWSDSNGWIGGAAPDVTQDVYISHGGAVELDANSGARSLRVASGNSVAVQDHRLTVDGPLTFDGAAISVGFGGTIVADSIHGDPAALTTTAGTLVQFNQFTRGASAATSLNFNGSVVVGNARTATSNGVTVYPVFNPDAIAVWNVAEHLFIGDEDLTATLVIDNGADFTSNSGRIGFSINRGQGHVVIQGDGSSWTIHGALDARYGSLNLSDSARLTTGSASVGDNDGQMDVTIDDATWIANGDVEVGPTVLANLPDLGRITIQNDGQMIVSGSVLVRGRSIPFSRISVESGGRLDASGEVITERFGTLNYHDDTTAGNENIRNRSGGQTIFSDTSGAGNATVNNLPSTPDDAFGQTQFLGNSSAEDGQFVNHGANVTFGSGGKTKFFGDASAGNGTFNNLAPTAGGIGGAVEFHHNSRADNGTFINRPGPSGFTGYIEFFGDSNGGSGTFINGGAILFHDRSKAGAGTYANTGEAGTKIITFDDHSSADQGTFSTTVGFGQDSRIVFNGNSMAGDATFTIRSNTSIQFQQNSTADHANITLVKSIGDAQFFSGGILSMNGGTLGHATITAEGGDAFRFAGGGVLLQGATAMAGDAVITLHGGSAAGAFGGTAGFYTGSSADNASIIAHGGTNGGHGAVVSFVSGGIGDNARVTINDGAFLDLLSNTSIGMLQGAGSFILRGNMLTTGGLGLDATISGIVADVVGSGGNLTKVGAGTLTLAGNNTYTGLTKVSGGSLVVNGSIAGNAEVYSGATLKGTGTIGGMVTVNPGGLFAPGNSPGTITIGGLALGNNSVLDFELGTVRDRIIVTGGDIVLDGTLNVSLLPEFTPVLGESFPLFEGTIHSISGAFDVVNAPIVGGVQLSVVYSMNQVMLQAGEAVLPTGDYNQNGTVDAADYTVWRNTLGSTTDLAADGDASGTIDAGDYDLWKTNFGQTAAAGGSPALSTTGEPPVSTAAVPEPSSLALSHLALFAAFLTAVAPRTGRQ